MDRLLKRLETALEEAGFSAEMTALCVRFASDHKITHLGFWSFTWRWTLSLVYAALILFLFYLFVVLIFNTWAPYSPMALDPYSPMALDLYDRGPTTSLGLAVIIVFMMRPRPRGVTQRDTLEARALFHIVQLAYDTRHDPSGHARALLRNFASSLRAKPSAEAMETLITAVSGKTAPPRSQHA